MWNLGLCVTWKCHFISERRVSGQRQVRCLVTWHFTVLHGPPRIAVWCSFQRNWNCLLSPWVPDRRWQQWPWGDQSPEELPSTWPCQKAVCGTAASSSLPQRVKPTTEKCMFIKFMLCHWKINCSLNIVDLFNVKSRIYFRGIRFVCLTLFP